MTRPTSVPRMAALAMAILCGLLFATLILPNKVNAAYDAGKIIDDSIFLDARSMSIADIHEFLASKGSGLRNMSFTLQCYGSGSQERQLYTSAGAQCDTPLPAADIIYYAGQIYGINPKVILATMQKEQSLTTAANPTSWQLNQAMGYACPTSGSCESSSSFPYQIDSGTWALRYHFERARGNLSWWKPATSWVCGTEKHLYKPNLYPGQNVRFYDTNGTHYTTVFIQNAATSAFYCYTPHAYNNPQGLYGRPPYGTTGLYYSGSYNFVQFYELWFGNARLPSAFKTSSSSTIYMYVAGYKLVVNQMAVMQDFGIAPQSIQTVSQAVADSIPLPPTGISTSINYIVKSPSDSDSDGGSIYYVARGKKYQVQSMDQFFAFNLKESQIRYVPLEFIKAVPGNDQLSNFVSSPTGNLFSVAGSQKRLFFEYGAYIQANPQDKVTPVSYYEVDAIPSGNPIVDRPTLIKRQNSESIYLLADNAYYGIPTYDTYTCWGFSTTLKTPEYRVTQNSYVQTPSPGANLTCAITESAQSYILNGTSRYLVPSTFDWTPSSAPQQLATLANKLPLRSTPLRQYVKSHTSSAVWYIQDGVRRLVPTYRDFTLLGLTDSSIDKIPQTTLSELPSGGEKLADGQVVKSTASSTVYVIFGGKRYIHTYQTFVAYKNNWSHVQGYGQTNLDTYYPLDGEISSTFYDARSDKLYLLGPTNCYVLSSEQLSVFGLTTTGVSASQPYNHTAFPSLEPSRCAPASKFVRSEKNALVYMVEDGNRHPIHTWSKLTQLAGSSSPNVIILNDDVLAGLPIDDAL